MPKRARYLSFWVLLISILVLLPNGVSVFAQTTETIQINFQEPGTAPSGFEIDTGAAYGDRGNDLTYGWLDDTDVPTSFENQDRTRGILTNDLLRDSLIHMNHPSTAPTAGRWEIEIDNGTYEVTVSVGDPSAGNDPESHVIVVEGTTIIDGFEPTGGNGALTRFTEGTGTVTVSDGKLTMDDPGGVNTKPNYIIIEPVETTPSFDVQVNFQASPDSISGYVVDNGNAYGDRGNGFEYGWLSVANGQPFDASVNARDRVPASPTLQNTLMHLRYNECCPTGNNGTQTPVFWEIAVPSGTYTVTASIGDPNNENQQATAHILSVEGVELGAGNQSLTPTEFTVEGIEVTDGKMTVDQSANGFNTKINYIEIASEGDVTLTQPRVLGANPADGATNVSVNLAGISSTGLALLNIEPNGVEPNSLNSTTVRLMQLDGSGNEVAQVPWVSVNTTGGFDAITGTPDGTLLPFTTYRWIIDGVEDQSGNVFEYFESEFTTGADDTVEPGEIKFTATDTNETGAFTSLAVGPDGRLYATAIFGALVIWDIDPTTGDLSNRRDFSPSPIGGRAIIGLEFDPNSTPTNPIVWVAHNQGSLNGGQHFTGAIARLTVENHDTANESWSGQDFVVGLPRSHKDHLTNSLELGPDGKLYLTQGSITAMGDLDSAWSYEPETMLSAAILRIDQDLLVQNHSSSPLDVTTGVPNSNGDLYTGSLVNGEPVPGNFLPNYGLGDSNGLYDPLADGALVTLYATGLRNAYDLLWHSNGNLYSATNGSAGGGSRDGGAARTPGTPTDFQNLPQCNNRIGDNPVYTGGAVTSENPPTQDDLFFRIVEGKYYGHPNPMRCEWVLNGGNPTGGTSAGPIVGDYPLGTDPDPNYGGVNYNFGKNKSPNGTIEYVSNTFNNALKGKILIVRYSQGDDVYVLDVDSNGDIIASSAFSLTDENDNVINFNSPLDLTEDARNGNIYVAAYQGQRIFLLNPVDSQATPEPNILVSTERDPLIFDQVISQGASAAQQITIANNGTGTLNISNVTFTGSGFTLPNGFPSTVAAGQSETLDVAFDPSGEGVVATALNIASNDPDTPTVAVSLRGLGKDGTGGASEPSLQFILDTFDLGIEVGDDNDSTNVIHSDTGSAKMNSLFGDEVEAQSFQKAGSGSVDVELLAVFGPTGDNPIVQVGWYASGDANSTTELFNVDNTLTSNGQRLLPPLNGVTSFDPGDGKFGFYSQWPFFSDRQLFSEDALNTFSGAIPHHVRVYPVPGEANTYIVATEEHVSGFDYQDVILKVSNVEPVEPDAAPSGEINLVNLDWDGANRLNGQNIPELDYLNRWLTMSRIQNYNTSSSGHLFRQTAILRIENTSTTDPLSITGLNISDTSEFVLPNGEDQNLPLVIQPNDDYELTVEFIESGGGKGIRLQTLTITSSATNEPTVEVTLAGSFMGSPEGGNEITADQVADAFGIDPSPGVNLIPLSSDYEAKGEEVLSFQWQRADTSKPVYVRQLAAFHGCFDQVSFSISGSGGFNHAGRYCQSLLPGDNNNNDPIVDPAEQLYTSTNATFTLSAAGYSTSRCSAVNPPEDCQGHGMRLWPVYNPDGDLVPNVYFVIQDYVGSATGTGCGAGSANCDFNDNMYLVTNIEPVTMPDPSLQIAQAIDSGEAEEEVAVNVALDVTLTVTNDLIFDAENVEVSYPLPTGFAFNSATDATCSDNAGTVTCDLGTVAGAQAVELVLNVTPQQIVNGATATATVTSGNFSGTSNTLTFNVVDPANLPGTITIVKDADIDTPTVFEFAEDITESSFTLTDDGSTVGGSTIEINFQVATSPRIDGFIPDIGLPYGDRGADGDGFTFGWKEIGTNNELTENGVDSSGAGTAGGSRDRDGAGTLASTLNHMQRGDCCDSGFLTPQYWEIELPNGPYEVTVSVGDTDNEGQSGATHVINAEGVQLVQLPVATGEAASQTGTAVVEVTDGDLTLDPIGGFNTKVQWVTITPLELDNQIVFSSVTPGSYTIIEQPVADWTLADITCTDNDSGRVSNTDSLLINLAPGEDVTCTFFNEFSILNQSPEIVSNPVTEGTVGELYEYTVQVTDFENNIAAIEFDTAPAWLNITDNNDNTALVSGTPDAAGTFDVVITVNDDFSSAVQQSFQIVVTEPINNCPPISTLPCDQIAVNLPFSLDFDSTENGLSDTGFTMVQAPSARLAVDDPIFDTDVPGYEPSKLSVTGGSLLLEATKGIQYSQPSGSPSSTETNSLINGLGVGFEPAAFPVRIETTVVNPAFNVNPGNSNSQQAGLWFGISEDQYIKLVVSKTGATTGKVQLLTEDMTAGTNTASTLAELNTGNLPGDITQQSITLIMELDTDGNGGYIARGYYSLDGGTTETLVVEGADFLAVPSNAFIDGEDHDANASTAPITYAGVFGTLRRGDAASPITFEFSDFSIAPQGNLPPQIAAIAPVTVEEGTPISVAISATDPDDDTVSFGFLEVVIKGTETAATGDYALTATGTNAATFTWTDATVGEYTATFMASDSENPMVTGTFDITVTEPVIDPASLTGTVVVQSMNDTHGYKSATLTVEMYAVGEAQTPSYTFAPTATAPASVNAATFEITGIEPGTYQVAVKAANTLQVVEVVTFTEGADSSVDFGVMLAGDVNDDNQINAFDFSILSNAFFVFDGTPYDEYDPRADFNLDGIVNPIDFSILSNNFLELGEIPQS